MVARTKLRCAGDSHPGMVRTNNEDRFHFDPDRGIFLVIDGIGGHAAGEKAADIAMGRVRARLERQTGSTEERIREAITVANNEILREAGANPEWQGMACVLTVAVVDNGSATIGHVGDSRLYKIRRGEIRKCTHDHSPVGEREDHGEISEAEAMRHPRRNEVYRDVGTEEHAPDDADFIEVLRIAFEPDSALLLCSDGLSDQVTSAEILRTVTANAGHPYGAVHELIDAANREGGKDNVTVLIVEGEQFAAAREMPETVAPRSGNPFAGKPALFVYGFACAALIFAGVRYFGLLDARPAPPPPPARTLNVGPGGFTSIHEALEKARPGDTVEVSSGEYAEQVRLKSGITLKSRGPDVAAILRAAPDDGGPGVAMVAEGVKGARVSGFRILADDKAPLATGVAIADSDLELQDTEIVGANTGIEIRGNSKPVLRANSIQDCRDRGIHVSGNSAPWLLYNAILHNGRRPRDPGQGVLIEEPARPVLIGNIFGYNGGDNAGDPIGMPAGPDRVSAMKFNFFLTAKPPARTPRGAAR
jgi:serine/threonine protein phosphatase PrpC